ncbi:MAG: prepilin-type N-terminal cleavage/methylation domain-containing protein [Terriglobia bacterium]
MENPTRRAAGFSLIELLIVVAIILIIAAIALPNLSRARRAAHESSAVYNLRTINSGLNIYYHSYSNGFPPELIFMGRPAAGSGPSCNRADVLDESLACTAPPCRKKGYGFTYRGVGTQLSPRPGSPCTQGGYLGYEGQARPDAFGISGVRSFFVDTSGVIRGTSEDRAANAADPPV